MCVSLALTQPPPSQVAVVSGGEDDQELSKLKVKVRSEVLQRPAKSSGRRTQVKILRPPAGSTAEDKEVGTTHTNLLYLHVVLFLHFLYVKLYLTRGCN